ncbi:AAA family ATPase, partial [Candidatus Poribacteria bacterium]|nr:AAA family ATPase [Candidatus Poribacteria bacterium]
VDEFQDINNVRINLLNRVQQLTQAYLFIIGDPNQSIYGYERLKEGGSMSPWPYYDDFNSIFSPRVFYLYDNHRSYPKILELATEILKLPEEHKHLIPNPTREPGGEFLDNYAKVYNRTIERIDWWNILPDILDERVNQKPYKQIAILFRTNNEVFRGFQKLKSQDLQNIRIRIQGSLPYEFTRIRECHEVISYLRGNIGQSIPNDFKQSFSAYINEQIEHHPNWNHFYLRVMHAVVLEYFDETDENNTFTELVDFIKELTYKDDGQLYKIYEKHLEKVSPNQIETEIVLTTMHKVKGLEFDCVIIPPSFSNLPLNIDNLEDPEDIKEQLEEEKRLAFVSFTRAKYRLLVFRHRREYALLKNETLAIPEENQVQIGIPVHPEIKKLFIGWAANVYNYRNGVNGFIRDNVNSGDFIFVKRRTVPNNGNPFDIHELFKEGSTRAIGRLSRDAGQLLEYRSCRGYVVNEIVVWEYEDTVKFDQDHETNYSNQWCQNARDVGYVYLVDFAGYGIPGE